MFALVYAHVETVEQTIGCLTIICRHLGLSVENVLYMGNKIELSSARLLISYIEVLTTICRDQWVQRMAAMKNFSTNESFISLSKLQCETHLLLVPHICQQIGSALVQIMAFRLFDVKPSSKPMLGYCQLDPWEQTSVTFLSKHSRKCI